MTLLSVPRAFLWVQTNSTAFLLNMHSHIPAIPAHPTNHNRHKMAAGDQQQFCLRWNDFQTNMVSSFKHLRDEKSFTDVTLACDGQTCKAHKMVLSACSPYFKVSIRSNVSYLPRWGGHLF